LLILLVLFGHPIFSNIFFCFVSLYFLNTYLVSVLFFWGSQGYTYP
jgi:hypothetical protein